MSGGVDGCHFDGGHWIQAQLYGAADVVVDMPLFRDFVGVLVVCTEADVLPATSALDDAADERIQVSLRAALADQDLHPDPQAGQHFLRTHTFVVVRDAA